MLVIVRLVVTAAASSTTSSASLLFAGLGNDKCDEGDENNSDGDNGLGIR